MQTITTIGLDIAKSVFQVHGVDAAGEVVIRRQLKRRSVLAFFQKLPPCLVGIEACASSHHWSRELQALGHTVRLMPPAYVKPYVKRQKNDAADAEAICEAVTRANMRFVPTKTLEQQSCLMLHRLHHGVKPGALIPALSAADANIFVDLDNLPTGSLCHRLQLAALIVGVLLRGAEAEIICSFRVFRILTQPGHLRGAVSTAGFICSRIHALCLLTNFPFVFSPISTSPQPSLISMMAARPKSAIS